MTRLLELFAHPRAIYFLVALFIALGTLYSVTTPIFEAGDELWHYPHVQWIARGNGLPIQDPAQNQLWEQEGGQPPLYYMTNAALTFWIDTSDLQERLWRNPFAQIGIPLAFGNKNMVVHTSAENFPWQNTALAVHLIRLLSVLFSAGTVYFTYCAAKELARASKQTDKNPGTRLALLAAAMVAFNPMFLFISASVNNDSLAALLATGALYLLLQLVTRGATNGRLLTTGIVCGLAVMSKVSNIAVIGVAGVVVLWLAWKTRDWKLVWRAGARVGIPVVLIAGWWFVRNFQLYGDPLAFNVWMQIAGGRAPQTLLGLIDEFQGFRISFWGNFGGVNVIAPDWVYTTLDVFSLMALVGLLVGWLKHRLPALLWIPALHLGVVFVALIRWTLMTYASQGRLMFPAIAAVAMLMAYGLYQLGFYGLRFTTRVSRIANRVSPIALPALLVAFLFVFAIAAPFFIIAPVYAQPARLANDAAVPNPVHIFFDAGDAQPELVGYETTRFMQGNELPLTLYWRSAQPIPQDLAMYVHLYDVRGNSLGQWDAFPGNGLAPTRLWRPNEILVDHYRIPVSRTNEYPPIGRIEVGLSRVGSTRPLTAHDPSGSEITPILTQFNLSQTAGIPVNARTNFGEQFGVIDLALGPSALKPGDTIKLSVTLQAHQVPDANYVLFAHLVDAQSKIIAQHDAQPLDNSYPTKLWNANEQVRDTLTLKIPQNAVAGNYTLEFGMYRASDLQRLPVNGASWEIWQTRGDHLTASPVAIEP